MALKREVRTLGGKRSSSAVEIFRLQESLKIDLSSVGKMYLVCALLRNAITCLHGNQTSEFFDLELSTLEEHFQ